ncbi:MAG: ribonuclease HIII [Lentisphaerae bacterium]|nr:ribonuclease HIII [Lentisphaerota bacterium]
MTTPTSFSYKLTPAQQDALVRILREGNYRPAIVPHTIAAAKGEDYSVSLYTSGKCLVQGKGAQDFVLFILEPGVLQQAGVGYETVLNPESVSAHMGIDESGKGDFFGPMVIASAYVDESLADTMKSMGVRDSKAITSDAKAMAMGRDLRTLLGPRFSLVKIGPRAYNRLYAKMRSVNVLLAWGHARAIENLLDVIPNCPRAISDQFGNEQQVKRALMQKGRAIELIQRHRAESDLAVAAASIIAREAFLRSLGDLSREYDMKIPKGASAAVQAAAVEIARRRGAPALVDLVKCHFKTTDQVLTQLGETRKVLGPEGQVVSRPFGNTRWKRKSASAPATEAEA